MFIYDFQLFVLSFIFHSFKKKNSWMKTWDCFFGNTTYYKFFAGHVFPMNLTLTRKNLPVLLSSAFVSSLISAYQSFASFRYFNWNAMSSTLVEIQPSVTPPATLNALPADADAQAPNFANIVRSNVDNDFTMEQGISAGVDGQDMREVSTRLHKCCSVKNLCKLIH